MDNPNSNRVQVTIWQIFFCNQCSILMSYCHVILAFKSAEGGDVNFLLAKKRDDGNLKVRDCNVNNDKQDGEGNSPRDAEDVFCFM